MINTQFHLLPCLPYVHPSESPASQFSMSIYSRIIFNLAGFPMEPDWTWEYWNDLKVTDGDLLEQISRLHQEAKEHPRNKKMPITSNTHGPSPVCCSVSNSTPMSRFLFPLYMARNCFRHPNRRPRQEEPWGWMWGRRTKTTICSALVKANVLKSSVYSSYRIQYSTIHVQHNTLQYQYQIQQY